MRELVLGGGGLIGSTLAAMLKERGHEVMSLDLKTGCDLRRADVDAPVAACDRVWFLAWDTGGAKYIEAEDSQHQQYKNNTEITLRVLDTLARARKPFVFTSSQLTVVPNAYGVTKLLAEKWSQQLGGKIARLWNTYGWEEPDVKSHVVTDLVLAALTRRRVECMTDGGERRRFIYKTDCAEAIITLAESEQGLAHIAGTEWLSIREVAEEIARQLGVEVALGAGRGTEHIIDPEYALPDWRPKVSLAEGIARVIADARAYLGERRTAEA
jgi:nucleoside-diphosphate-sugar epimerase